MNAAELAGKQAEDAQKRNRSMMEYAQGVSPFQGQNYGTQIAGARAAQQESRGQQMSLGQALLARSRGEGASLAEQQLQRSTQSQAAQIAAQLGAQRGVSPAMAARQAAMTGGAMQQQAAAQAAMLRAQEQQQAQAILSQHLGQQRQQDLGMYATGVQGLGQQNALGVQMSQAAMQDQAQRDALAVGEESAEKQRWFDLWGNILGGLTQGVGAAGAKWALAWDGGEIPGRAHHAGDHPANDTVPALLSPGEVVLPRSVAQAPNAPERAKSFVEALREREEQKQASKLPPGLAAALQKHISGLPSEPRSTAPAQSSSLPPGLAAALRKHLATFAGGGEVPGDHTYLAALVPPPRTSPLPWLRPPSETEDPPERQIHQLRNARSQPPSINPPEGQANSEDHSLSNSGLRATADGNLFTRGNTNLNEDPNALLATLSANQPGTTPPIVQLPRVPQLEPGGAWEQEAKDAAAELKAANQARADFDPYKAEEAVEAKQAITSAEEAVEAAQTEANKARDMVRDSTIDPQRLFTNQSTGKRVMMLVSLVLGGIGSGLTKGPNAALQVMDNEINRDIEAQKAEMGKQQTLYSMAMDTLQDSRAAEGIARANLRDVVAGLIEREARKYEGHVGAANAMRLSAELSRQAAEERRQISAWQYSQELERASLRQSQEQWAATYEQNQQRLDMERGQVEQERTQKEHLADIEARLLTQGPQNLSDDEVLLLRQTPMREEMVTLPDGTVGLAVNKEDAAQIRGGLIAYETMIQQMDRYLEMANKVKDEPYFWWQKSDQSPRTILNSEGKALASAIYTDLVSRTARMRETGVLTDEDIKRYQKMVPDLTNKFRNAAPQVKQIKLLRQLMDEDMRANMNNRLLGPRKGAPQGMFGAPRDDEEGY